MRLFSPPPPPPPRVKWEKVASGNFDLFSRTLNLVRFLFCFWMVIHLQTSNYSLQNQSGDSSFLPAVFIKWHLCFAFRVARCVNNVWKHHNFFACLNFVSWFEHTIKLNQILVTFNVTVCNYLDHSIMNYRDLHYCFGSWIGVVHFWSTK